MSPRPQPSLIPQSCLLLVMLLTSGLLFGCESSPTPTPAPEVNIPFRTDGTLTFHREGAPIVTIDIEIADTDSTRTRGLMQRTSLPERSGMLFLFPSEVPQGFWMANTPLSLDILYVDADSQVVSVAKYTTPFSTATIPSGLPARFVVEVEAGFTDAYGIAETDRVRWVDQRSE